MRQECQEILAETNRLLLAKRELALQQSQVSEIINELSQRTIFATPHRPAHGQAPASSSAASSSFQPQVITLSPAVPSRVGQQPQPSAHAHQRARPHHSDGHHPPQPFPMPAASAEPSEPLRRRKEAALGPSLLRDSVNSLLSSASQNSLPLSLAQAHAQDQSQHQHQQQPAAHTNPNEHLLRLYPEMISPRLTKQLISKVLRQKNHELDASTAGTQE